MSKLNSTMWAVALIALCILSFLLWRGCQKARSDNNAITILADSLSNLSKQREADAQASIESKKQFEETIAFNDGQLELKDNQLAATSSQLDVAQLQIKSLLKKHTPIAPSDSAITTVPNEFVEECSQCFAHLERQTALIETYRGTINEKDALSRESAGNFMKRIDQLEGEKQRSDELVNDYKEIAQAAVKRAQVRRMMYLNMGAIGMQKDILIGVGAGLTYQDKRRRMFGFTWYGTNQGSIVTGNLSFPLSFKRK